MYPLLVVSQTIPALVLAPILIVWLGFGLLPEGRRRRARRLLPDRREHRRRSRERRPRAHRPRAQLRWPAARRCSGSCRCRRRSRRSSRAEDRRDVRGRRRGDRRVDGCVRGARARDDPRVTRRSASTASSPRSSSSRSSRSPVRARSASLARLATPWTAATRNARQEGIRVKRGSCSSSLVVAVARRVDRGRCGATTRAVGDDDARGRRRTNATLVLNWTPNAHHLGVYAARAARLVSRRGHRPRDRRADRSGRRASRRARARPSSAISIAEGVLPGARSRASRSCRSARSCPVNDSALMSLAERRHHGAGGPRGQALRRLQRPARDRADQPAGRVRRHRSREREARRSRQRRLPRRPRSRPLRRRVDLQRLGRAARQRCRARRHRPDPIRRPLRLHPELVHAAVHHEREDDRGSTRRSCGRSWTSPRAATSSRSTIPSAPPS